MPGGNDGSAIELSTGGCAGGCGGFWAFARGNAATHASNNAVAPITFLMLSFTDLHYYNHDLKALNHYNTIRGRFVALAENIHEMPGKPLSVRSRSFSIFTLVKKLRRTTVPPSIGNFWDSLIFQIFHNSLHLR
jgi:hypothetical protein